MDGQIFRFRLFLRGIERSVRVKPAVLFARLCSALLSEAGEQYLLKLLLGRLCHSAMLLEPHSTGARLSCESVCPRGFTAAMGERTIGSG